MIFKSNYKESLISPIPYDWKIAKIAEVSKKIIDCLHSKKPTFISKSDKVFLEVLNIGDSGELNLKHVNYISDKDYSLWTKRIVPKYKDIIITKTGRVGAVAMIPQNINCCIGRNQVLIRSDKNIMLPDFLLYYFLSPQFRKELTKQKMLGTILESLHVKNIPRIRVPVPEIKEQSLIVKLLQPLYEKKALNNQINKNLEELAETIFKRWFVDFEFPNENGEPYKSSGGEMIESELGQIPKVWEVIKLEDIADERKFSIVDGPFGTQLHAEEYQEVGIPVIRVTNLSFEGNFLRDSLVYITEEKFSHLIRSSVFPRDILLAKTGATIGKLARVPKSIKKGLIASSVLKISPNSKKFNEYFLFNTIKELSKRRFWEGISGGSTRPTINLADVKNIKLVYPSKNHTMKAYHEIVDFLYKLIEHNREQNITLSKIWDILLPRLMSGEIRVPIESLEKDS